MKKESKGLSLLKNLDLAIAGVLLVVLIFLTFFGVARRYLFGKPLIWMEEFQGLLFLWITFLGAGAAFRYGSHVKIDMVLDALHGTARKVLEILDHIVEFGVLIYFFYQCWTYYFRMIDTGKKTDQLRWTYDKAYWAVPVGAILMILSFLISIYLTYFRKPKEEETAVKEVA